MDLTADRAKLKQLYMPGTEDFVLVDVPELPFAMIDGHGDPEQGAGAQATKCLFTTIQPIRREARAHMGKAFVEARSKCSSGPTTCAISLPATGKSGSGGR